MPPDVVSKPLNSNENSRGAEFLSKRYPEKLAQAFGYTPVEFAQQFAIVQKELSHYFLNGENILPMRYWIKKRLFGVMVELDHLFVMAAGTKSAPSAVEGE